jgi:hypothetical protein
MRKIILRHSCLFLGAALCVLSVGGVMRGQNAPASLGPFQNHSDVGMTSHAGSAQYDSAQHAYTLTGSGENMWFTADAFQFAWKQVSGDIALSADIDFPEKGGNPHRKAVLMIRQNLDPDSPYADAALHGDGLASLQYRDAKGATTHEIQSNISAPRRLRIEKRGDFIYVFVGAASGETLRPSGASLKLPMQGSFYVGIGVCSHDQDAAERAVFTNLHLAPPAVTTAPPVLYSTLETVAIASTDRRVVYTDASHFEAPNWTHDGAYFLLQPRGPHPAAACSKAERPQPSTPVRPRIATTTTAFPRTRTGWPSAISRSPTASRACTSCPSKAARLAASRKTLRPTGTAGRPTARRSPSSANATASSTSTPSPSPEATRRD